MRVVDSATRIPAASPSVACAECRRSAHDGNMRLRGKRDHHAKARVTASVDGGQRAAGSATVVNAL